MRFSAVFSTLEEVRKQGKIKEFSIFTSTLEQIFLKFAKYQKRENNS